MDRLHLIVLVVFAISLVNVPPGLSGIKVVHKGRQNRSYDAFLGDMAKGAVGLERTSAKGPNSWKVKYPGCNGKHQSPVDIDTDLVQCDGSLHDFVYSGYDTIPSTPFFLLRIREVQGVLFETEQNDIRVSNDWLQSSYSLYLFTFCIYGDLVNGEEAQLYLYLMHWNADKYNSVLEAEKHSDGIVSLEVHVLATSDEDEIDREFSDSFDEIIQAAGSETFVPTFPLSSLLPSNGDYYKYPGSYTAPPCHESVTAVVYRQPIHLAGSQIESFLQAFHETKVRKQNIARPPQPLNDRVVTSSCN